NQGLITGFHTIKLFVHSQMLSKHSVHFQNNVYIKPSDATDLDQLLLSAQTEMYLHQLEIHAKQWVTFLQNSFFTGFTFFYPDVLWIKSTTGYSSQSNDQIAVTIAIVKPFTIKPKVILIWFVESV